MPYLTLTENLKLQLSPGLVASYDIQWVYFGTNTHTFTYLLTYLINRSKNNSKSCWEQQGITKAVKYTHL